jgi:hypothetical protein
MRYRDRYRERPNLAAMVRDVAEALVEGRVGKRTPDNRRKASRDAVLAWTPTCDRVYLMRQTGIGWLVLTVLAATGNGTIDRGLGEPTTVEQAFYAAFAKGHA